MEFDFEKPVTELEARIKELKTLNTRSKGQFATELVQLERELAGMKTRLYGTLTPWQTVQLARHPDRPNIKDYTAGILSEFIELHGDRHVGDDQGIIGGMATIGSLKIMLIGHQKGRTLDDNLKSNFGMANPEGYRKAMRLMHLAEKYHMPVVTFIDTPGAYPGLDAEARGQAEAIARNLLEMATLKTPVLTIITGEGGSGGAIGIGVGDIVLMLSNAVYSVISPEGCASILWRDGTKAPQAAEALKITAPSLLELGIIDGIIPEPDGGAHRDPAAAMQAVKAAILKYLPELQKRSIRKLVDLRYEKYARMGQPAK
ncbi:MAG: acetyl-CoA carboxylase carboxyltransferase subunit alpha [Lentisphaerae bacterium RIFOXYC12_FULL_60_16]|nr:MAG: acetyl-CoA carboxylase carboxyltransferase subunit alpha [Lentisphaerae bacterium RIFOXYC12_FULL_60_16]